MNGRERVALALQFCEPDRVPIDLGGTTGASGIHVLAYAALRRHLGLPERPVQCVDVMQQLAAIDADVRERLHIDVIQISASSIAKEWRPHRIYPDAEDIWLPVEVIPHAHADGSWTLSNAKGQTFTKPTTSLYFDASDGKSWFSYSPPLTEEFLRRLECRARALYAESGCALSAAFGGGFLSPHPEFLMALLEEPEQMREVLNRQCDDLITRYRLLHQALGDTTFCAVFADDFGTQAAPMISPDLFREMIVPLYRRFTGWLKKETGWKMYLHSCGAIEPLLDDICEMGVDIINPVQTSAIGMEPGNLKKKYGSRLVFWGGGCDTQSVLGFQPAQQVAEHVKERLRIFAPGGGFVFNQVHAIQATVRPEDIMAIFDTAYEAGRYPVL